MPQDRPRSAVYRSFVTCHDPRDVLDCRTMRKSKTRDKKMDQVIEIRRNENTNRREIREDFNGESSFQLRQISREAENLNQIFDSWSERMSSVKKSKDIAEDLFKGTFHLKKSLVFLGKFHGDSTGHFQERIQSQIQKTCSDQIGDPKNGLDDLKKAIRLSVEKQNSSLNEKICLPARNLDSPSETSFTSSSKSSMESTLSSESSQKMGKSTTLIARLMGLEQMPIEAPSQATYHKKLQGKDERPKTMKFQSVINGADDEKRTLKKILQTMHFKGILENKSVKEFDLQQSHSHRWEIDTATPIVLMKPAPNIHSEDQKTTMIQEEAVDVKKKMFIKTKKKFEPKKRLEVKEITIEKTIPEERKKTMDRAITKSKTSSPANGKPHLVHPNAQKSLKLQKEIKTTPKPSVKKSVKVELVSRPQDQSKETSIRSKRPAIEANLGNKRSQTHLKHGSETQTDSKKDKKEKCVKESRGAKSKNADKEDRQRTDLQNETASTCQSSSTSMADLHIVQEKKDSRETEIGEFCHENQSSGEKQSFKTATNLETLLLNSPLFTSQAQDLLDINLNDEAILRSSKRNDFRLPGTRLLFDCALELIEYRSLQKSEAAFQLSLHSSRENSRAEASLENLVEEICNGIEELESLSKIDPENLSEEAFCALLKRDVGGRKIVTGLWDFGWRNSYSMEDAEKAVNCVEKLVLSELIADIFP